LGALRVFKEHIDEISLALLDVMMPKLSGRAVDGHIHRACPEIPVLFSSGYSMNTLHINFVLDEELQLIQKPCQRDDLLRKVREALEQRGAAIPLFFRSWPRFFEPGHIKASKGYGFIRTLFAMLVEACDVAVLEFREVGVGRGASVQHLLMRPSLAIIKTEAHRHVLPFFGVGGVGEKERLFALVATAPKACLADRLGERRVEALVFPSHAAILAEGDLTVVLVAVVIAHVEHKPSVGELGHFAFVDLVLGRDAPKFPAFAVIVGVDDVGIVVLCGGFDVVAGDHEPVGVGAVQELDARAGAGGVPGPIRTFRGCRDLIGLGPRPALIGGVGDEYAARILAASLDDQPFTVFAEIPRHEQPNRIRHAIIHRAGITARVFAVAPHNLLGTPGFAVVFRASHEHVDAPRVALSAHAPFAKREDAAGAGGEEGGNTVGVVAALTADEEGRLLRFGDGASGEAKA
jgi:hypothetical protein